MELNASLAIIRLHFEMIFFLRECSFLCPDEWFDHFRQKKVFTQCDFYA